MTTRIDCETLRQYRDEYLRGHGPSEPLVDSHLAECPSCLEAFLDVTLATPTTIAPPWGFATRVVANLPPEPSSGARGVILAISALLGMHPGVLDSLLPARRVHRLTTDHGRNRTARGDQRSITLSIDVSSVGPKSAIDRPPFACASRSCSSRVISMPVVRALCS